MRYLLALSAVLAACRGDVSESPPIHLNPNMDNQERYDPQEPDPFFRDGRAMRPEVPGTVAVGSLTPGPMTTGTQHGKPLQELPLKLTGALLERGRQRFDIYCSPCHGGAGMGDGIVIKRGMLPPPSFHELRLRAMPLGQMYHAIRRGVRSMPSYAAQVPVPDRWAIVAYIRALQISRSADLKQIPADIATSRGWSAK